MKKLFFLLLFISLTIKIFAGNGIVVFRFDDNKPVELWKELNLIFRKHGYNFSLAVSPLKLTEKQAKVLKELQSEGNEIMDHTPTHSNMKISFPSVKEAEKYADHPGVECRINNVLCLKLAFDPNYRWNRKLKITVKDGKIISPDEKVKKELKNQNYLVFPDGKICGVKEKNGVYTICSAWDHPCKVADAENIEVIRSDRYGVQTTDDGLRLLAEISKEKFEVLGLGKPKCYVVAGGWGCYPNKENLWRVFGREYGYTCGTAVNRNFGVYGKSYSESDSFAIACSWNSPENRSVEELKKMITDYMEKNCMIPVLSHLWYQKVPGGKDELLKRYDELLGFLKEKNITVLTMSQAAEKVYKAQ